MCDSEPGSGAPVSSVSLHRVRLPLRTPHVAAYGREVTREVILVRVTDAEGGVGWGECPTLARPGYTGEWTDGAWFVLGEMLGPAVLGGTADRPVIGPAGHPMATGALRDALLDLRLRRAGRSLARHLGAKSDAVPFGAAVGLYDDPGALVAAVEDRLVQGAIHVTVKGAPGALAGAVRVVRAAHPGLGLAADANGSFRTSTDPELTSADEVGLTHLEQPLPADDLIGLAALGRILRTPVALDESVTSPAEAATAIDLAAGRILTVKAARLGGLDAAVHAARLAAVAGWGVLVGGMLESGIGRSAALALAALDLCTLPTVVGPADALLADDVVEPVRPDAAGRIPVHRGPGIGPVPDPARLARLTVDRRELTTTGRR